MNAKIFIYLRAVVFFAVVAVVAVITTLSLYWLWYQPGQSGRGAIVEISRKLDLSAEEEAEIAIVHQRFQAEQSDVLREFQQVQRQLAALLKEERDYSPALTETIHRLHEAHAQLQELSIRRFFAMLEVLPPEKQERLRLLASETLSHPE